MKTLTLELELLNPLNYEKLAFVHKSQGSIYDIINPTQLKVKDRPILNYGHMYNEADVCLAPLKNNNMFNLTEKHKLDVFKEIKIINGPIIQHEIETIMKEEDFIFC